VRDRKECEEGWTKTQTQTQGTILLTSSSVLKVVAAGSVQEMSGWRTSAARNTRWDWETAGRVLVEASAGGLLYAWKGIMRILGGGSFCRGPECDGSVQRPGGRGRGGRAGGRVGG
jgi:hypothetical protein